MRLLLFLKPWLLMLLLFWELDISDTSDANAAELNNNILAKPKTNSQNIGQDESTVPESHGRLLSKIKIFVLGQDRKPGFVDSSQYQLLKSKNLLKLRFNDGLKCIKLKYGDQIVWTHDFDSYGYHYPREFVLSEDEITVEIRNSSLTYVYKNGQWTLSSKTSFVAFTYKDFTVVTLDSSDVKKTKINDSSQYDLSSYHNGLTMFVFKDNSRCVGFDFCSHIVWRFEKDTFSNQYPRSIVYKPDGTVFVNFDPWYLVYEFDTSTGKWKLNTNKSYIVHGLVHTSDHPKYLTVLTSDKEDSSDLKINDTSHYKLYSYFDNIYLYLFEPNAKCHEFRFRDSLVWKHDDNKEPNKFPRSISVDLVDSVIDIDFGDHTLRFRLSGSWFISYTVRDDPDPSKHAAEQVSKRSSDQDSNKDSRQTQDPRDLTAEDLIDDKHKTKTKSLRQSESKASDKVDKTVKQPPKPITSPQPLRVSQPTSSTPAPSSTPKPIIPTTAVPKLSSSDPESKPKVSEQSTPASSTKLESESKQPKPKESGSPTTAVSVDQKAAAQATDQHKSTNKTPVELNINTSRSNDQLDFSKDDREDLLVYTPKSGYVFNKVVTRGCCGSKCCSSNCCKSSCCHSESSDEDSVPTGCCLFNWCKSGCCKSSCCKSSCCKSDCCHYSIIWEAGNENEYAYKVILKGSGDKPKYLALLPVNGDFFLYYKENNDSGWRDITSTRISFSDFTFFGTDLTSEVKKLDSTSFERTDYNFSYGYRFKDNVKCAEIKHRGVTLWRHSNKPKDPYPNGLYYALYSKNLRLFFVSAGSPILRTQIGVDIDKSQSNFYETTKDDIKKTMTFTAKDEYLFHLVKQGNDVIWQTNDLTEEVENVVYEGFDSDDKKIMVYSRYHKYKFHKPSSHSKWIQIIPEFELELDIFRYFYTFDIDFEKNESEKTCKYVPRYGCKFNLIKEDNVQIWKASKESGCARKVFYEGLNEDKKKLTIYLEGKKKLIFEKKSKTEPWEETYSSSQSPDTGDQSSSKVASPASAPKPKLESTVQSSSAPSITVPKASYQSSLVTSIEPKDKTPITLDIEKESGDHFNFSKNDTEDLIKYSSKEGYIFNKLVKSDPSNSSNIEVIWESEDELKYLYQIILKGSGDKPKYLALLPVNGDFFLYYKENKNSGWQDITSTRISFSDFTFFGTDQSSSEVKQLDHTSCFRSTYNFMFCYKFKDGVKCTEIKHKNETIWTHGNDKSHANGLYLNLLNNKLYISLQLNDKDLFLALPKAKCELRKISIPTIVSSTQPLKSSIESASFGIDHLTTDTGSLLGKQKDLSINKLFSEFKIFTKGSQIPNNTTKYYLKITSDTISYKFKSNAECIEIRFKDKTLWKYDKSTHENRYPVYIFVHNDVKKLYIITFNLMFVCSLEGQSWSGSEAHLVEVDIKNKNSCEEYEYEKNTVPTYEAKPSYGFNKVIVKKNLLNCCGSDTILWEAKNENEYATKVTRDGTDTCKKLENVDIHLSNGNVLKYKKSGCCSKQWINANINKTNIDIQLNTSQTNVKSDISMDSSSSNLNNHLIELDIDSKKTTGEYDYFNNIGIFTAKDNTVFQKIIRKKCSLNYCGSDQILYKAKYYYDCAYKVILDPSGSKDKNIKLYLVNGRILTLTKDNDYSYNPKPWIPFGPPELTIITEGSKEPNDYTKYDIFSDDNIFNFIFKSGSKCTEVRYNNETVWKYEENDHKEYPKSLLYYKNETRLLLSFYLENIIYRKQHSSWKKTSSKLSVLDIDTRQVNDIYEYAKRDKTTLATFTVKKGHGFRKVIQKKPGWNCCGKDKVIWEADDTSEHAVKIIIDGIGGCLETTEQLHIYLANHDLLKFVKVGGCCSKEWIHVETKLHGASSNNLSDHDKFLSEFKQDSESTEDTSNSEKTNNFVQSESELSSSSNQLFLKNREDPSISNNSLEKDFKIFTLDPLDIRKTKENEISHYEINHEDNILVYKFKDDAKCVELKHGNHTVWENTNYSDFPKSIYLFKTVFLFVLEMSGNNFYLYGLSSDNKFESELFTGVSDLSESNIKIITKEGTNTNENDTSKYDFKRFSFALEYKFKDDAECTEVKLNDKTIWKFVSANNSTYPSFIYIMSDDILIFPKGCDQNQ